MSEAQRPRTVVRVSDDENLFLEDKFRVSVLSYMRTEIKDS